MMPMESDTSHGDKVDTGLVCLVMLARLHELTADADQLAHQFKADGKPFSKTEILLASKQLGLKARAVKTTAARLDRTPLPAMGTDNDGRFFIVLRTDGDQALIFSPLVTRAETVPLADLHTRWTGELILFTSRASLAGELKKFGRRGVREWSALLRRWVNGRVIEEAFEK
ncbi:MAG: cysteine peptidase family C39 domain-containing protein [Thermodesulfobacteriota bacterium]